MNRLLTAGVMLWTAIMAGAQEAEPPSVTVAHAVGTGQTEILDTYLSQEKFSGTGLTYLYQRLSSRNNWVTSLEQEISMAAATDRRERADELQGGYDIYWGKYRRWTLDGSRLALEAGGMATGHIGFVYNTVNSNNPAQAQLTAAIMPALAANYALRLPRWLQKRSTRRLALRYELQLPLVGVMFSPNYGQSYYEIFSLGNYDHNVVPTTLASAPTLRQQLSADWPVGSQWAIRLGYLGNYQQAKVNHLRQHMYAHRVMIGIVKQLKNRQHP